MICHRKPASFKSMILYENAYLLSQFTLKLIDTTVFFYHLHRFLGTRPIGDFPNHSSITFNCT